MRVWPIRMPGSRSSQDAHSLRVRLDRAALAVCRLPTVVMLGQGDSIVDTSDDGHPVQWGGNLVTDDDAAHTLAGQGQTAARTPLVHDR